jgi:hypothetical protein
MELKIQSDWSKLSFSLQPDARFYFSRQKIDRTDAKPQIAGTLRVHPEAFFIEKENALHNWSGGEDEADGLADRQSRGGGQLANPGTAALVPEIDSGDALRLPAFKRKAKLLST